MTKLAFIYSLIAMMVATAGFAGAKDVQFLHGWRASNGDHVSAIQITLEEGWKTYWRAPQGSGIPPMLSVERTEGLNGVELIFPKPKLYMEFGQEVLGYMDSVTFPVRFSVQDGSQTVPIESEFRFAVCKDVCIPLRFTISTQLDALQTSHISEIKAALAKQPASPRRYGIRQIACGLTPAQTGTGYSAKLKWPADLKVQKVVLEYPSDAVWIDPLEASFRNGALHVAGSLKTYGEQVVFFQRKDFRLSVLTQNALFEFKGC